MLLDIQIKYKYLKNQKEIIITRSQCVNSTLGTCHSRSGRLIRKEQILDRRAEAKSEE
jgi:hypothetical protein